MKEGQLLLLALCCTMWVATPGHASATVKRFKTNVDEGQAYWNQVGLEELESALNVEPNTNVAKNVILFLGDGMSMATETAARIYKGQQEGTGGEEGKLAFESFPHAGLSKTYCVDKQVADSASTATAYLTGVKTNYRNIGVDKNVKNRDCSTFNDDSKVESIVKWAQDAGKRTGVVTSTRITHATPSGAYAHTPERNWECDSYVKEDIGENYLEECSNFKDIARQLIEDEPGSSINVLMGGGLQAFQAPSHDLRWDDDWACERIDGVDLIDVWTQKKTEEAKTHAFVKNKTALMDVDDNTEYLLGLFWNTHLPYEHVKIEQGLDVPTLAEMTEKAITILQKGENGFFLLVEGGRIDHAHHDGTARRALDEAVAMDKAVEAALSLTNEEDTLIVVTADHAHSMSFNGYPKRGQDIVGLASIADDGLPLTTLMYNTGPGFNYTTKNGDEVTRWNLTETDTKDFEYKQQGEVYMEWSSHGGEDVAIYAQGPMSHLFHSSHEQNYIAHAMAYAACIGANTDIGDHCSDQVDKSGMSTGAIIGIVVGALLGVLIVAGVIWMMVKK